MNCTMHSQMRACTSKSHGTRPFTAAQHPPVSRHAYQPARQSTARSHASTEIESTSGEHVARDSSSLSSTANRRQLLSAAAAAAVLPALLEAWPAAAADAAPEGFKVMYDPILAYKFIYPVVTSGGQELQMTLTHSPEKYSSAAPLTADARQRIVSEVFDLRRFVTVSMTVGPASGVLKGVPQDDWKAKDVALTVLIDRSTARLSSGQRTALNDIEEVHKEERDGQTYFVYEHTTQGSPTVANPRPETFRHALAVTTTRPGLDGSPYLYTLNLSCPQPLWEELSGPFQTAVDSYRLVATTRDYIPPDQNPWLFF